MTQSDEQSDSHARQPSDDGQAAVWILVERSAHQAAFERVAQLLADRGIDAQIVTITDVIGSVARDALTGGAERLLRGLRVVFQGRGSEEDLLGAVRRARPDVLAVTNPRYGRALGLMESLSGIRTLQVGILPDFNLSTEWINSSLQAFVVPTDEHRQRLVSSGFLAERVLVAAPAIQAGFAAELDREQIRKDFGFGSEKVVLVRADQFAPHVLEKMVFQSTLVDAEARFVFHHNGDGACAAALRRAADQYGLPAAMFGKVDALERFVAASDLVVAVSSEPYIAEILAQGRPLLLVGADERGAAQAEYLTQQGAAHHVVDVLRLGSEVDRMLGDETLTAATDAAAKLGARDGNEQLAAALEQVIEHAQEWLRAPAGGAGPVPEDEGPGQEERPGGFESTGPFETIGTGKSTRGQATTPSGDGGERRARTERSFAGISQAEAKDQLAELILTERELERKLAECQKQQDRWRNRLELAREWNEQDLADEAKDILRGYLSDAEQLEQDLNDIRRQKVKLKRAAQGGAASSSSRALPPADDGSNAGRERDIEQRFRRMELDRDLDALKDKIDRDLGD